MRHVIIEGPDGAGKTTLARKLMKEHGLVYHHEGPPPGHVNVADHYSGLLKNAKEPTVFDRFHLGELVYGPLLRGASKLNRNDTLRIDQMIVDMGVTVVICLPPWTTCCDNTAYRAELIKSKKTLQAAYEAWVKVIDDPLLQRTMQFYDYVTMPDFQLKEYPGA